jgi:hypothetical protein
MSRAIYIPRPNRTTFSIGYTLRTSHIEHSNSTLQSTMFHVIFSLTSRFLYLRNILQGIARGILSLRSLDAISSHLTPAISPPPPVPLLDAPAPFVELPEQIVLPYPSRDVIAIERQFSAFASSFPIYQSSLIAVTPSQFPKFLPLLVILAVLSGFVVILPEITYFFMNIAKSFKSKPMFYCPPTSLPSQFASFKLPISLISLLLLWTGPVLVHSSFVSSSLMIFTIFPACNCDFFHIRLVHVHSFLLRAGLKHGTFRFKVICSK